MEKNQSRLATKAQAAAVREYLASIGCTVSHVQALEVLARGAGLRSRHLLAPQGAMTRTHEPETPASIVPHTRVAYSYADGAQCKRSAAVVFRGRLRPEQLQLIANRLDEGLFFVPAQVGFESLHLAFTDDGGDDHWWHKLELGEPAEWLLDDDGFVLEAGDVRQVPAVFGASTDADCDNLMWRFARLTKWDPDVQERALHAHAWTPLLAYVDEPSLQDRKDLVENWLEHRPSLQAAPRNLLEELALALREEHLVPVAPHPYRMRRGIAPNAYVLVEVEAQSDLRQLVLKVGVHSNQGKALVVAAPLTVCFDAQGPLWQVSSVVSDVLKQARVLPQAYDSSIQ